VTQQPPAVPSMTCVSVCCRQDMSTIRVWYWSFPSSPVCVLCNGCLCPIWSNMTRRIRTSFAASTVVWRPSCTNGGRNSHQHQLPVRTISAKNAGQLEAELEEDRRWPAGGRLPAFFRAFMGVFMMAMFVTVFGKKMTRG
jgi:hypothetical protein